MLIKTTVNFPPQSKLKCHLLHHDNPHLFCRLCWAWLWHWQTTLRVQYIVCWLPMLMLFLHRVITSPSPTSLWLGWILSTSATLMMYRWMGLFLFCACLQLADFVRIPKPGQKLALFWIFQWLCEGFGWILAEDSILVELKNFNWASYANCWSWNKPCLR